MNQREILICIHQLEGIGWKTISKLVTHLSDLPLLQQISSKQLLNIGLNEQQINRIQNHVNVSFLNEVMHKYASQKIGIITIFDDEYPLLLKEINQPPWVLYYKGNADFFNQNLLAVVGTRNPTYYGKNTAEHFAMLLSQQSFTIVSGLARGIDSHAHFGALLGKGKTIAVLGCAIDICYPAENKKLYEQIADHGLICSEYPIGTTMHVGMFPQRNRILAGLSLGVIIIEAASKSGSLITVDYAIQENRDVFAVPGQISSRQSEGTLNLIKQGCKMITCIQDIVEEYSSHFHNQEHVNHKPIGQEYTKLEQKIIEYLSDEPLLFDELLQKSNLPIGKLHEILYDLQNKKYIKQLPGFYFQKMF